MPDLIDDLLNYNDWANEKVLSLCDGLTDQQLDAPREMGFGTLRATLFHILTADVVWMERWQSVPWRPFPTDPAGMPLAEITESLQKVSDQRRVFLQEHRKNRWSTRVQYQDSGKNSYDHVLFDLVLHVFSHGVHHRAQGLNYLRQFDRGVVAGIDYIFYRLARHARRQSQEALSSLQEYGLAVGSPTEEPCPWDPSVAQRLFVYHDWAIDQILQFANQCNDAALDREFEMGPGSLRKTILHLFDAETWWINNWTKPPGEFPQSDPLGIAEIASQWSGLREQRNQFIQSVGDEEAQRSVEILAGGPPTKFVVGESIIHVAIHATHHRAQIINMLRHVDAAWKNIDLLYAIDELG